METYEQMKRRHQSEVNAFPLGAALTQDNFDKMMKGWGLDPKKDIGKICRVANCMFCQKKDIPALKEMLGRHTNEMEARKNDPKFLYQMFYYELANTEFGYDGDSSRALELLGYTYEQIEASPEMSKAFEKAKKDIWNRCD